MEKPPAIAGHISGYVRDGDTITGYEAIKGAGGLSEFQGVYNTNVGTEAWSNGESGTRPNRVLQVRYGTKERADQAETYLKSSGFHPNTKPQ